MAIQSPTTGRNMISALSGDNRSEYGFRRQRRGRSSVPYLPTVSGTRTFPSLQYILNANDPARNDGRISDRRTSAGHLPDHELPGGRA